MARRLNVIGSVPKLTWKIRAFTPSDSQGEPRHGVSYCFHEFGIEECIKRQTRRISLIHEREGSPQA